MKPELFALFTALFWALGSYFGKAGLHMANLQPKVGLVIRLAVSLVIVAVIAGPKLNHLVEAAGTTAGRKGLIYLFIFEGIVAGAFGMLFYYNAIKSGQLSKVMPIAFTTPLWGFLLAVTFAGEKITLLKGTGAGLAILGILLLTAS